MPFKSRTAPAPDAISYQPNLDLRQHALGKFSDRNSLHKGNPINFDGCDLRGSRLTAYFSDIYVGGANLSGADWELIGCRLYVDDDTTLDSEVMAQTTVVKVDTWRGRTAEQVFAVCKLQYKKEQAEGVADIFTGLAVFAGIIAVISLAVIGFLA